MSEPKDDGKSEPKDDGKSEPKDDGKGLRRTDAANSGAFGGGTGFVVVAFISPVGLNVPDLAVRMLQGGNAAGVTPPRVRALGRTAAVAQEQARKQAREQEKLKLQVERIANGRKESNGRRAT